VQGVEAGCHHLHHSTHAAVRNHKIGLGVPLIRWLHGPHFRHILRRHIAAGVLRLHVVVQRRAYMHLQSDVRHRLQRKRNRAARRRTAAAEPTAEPAEPATAAALAAAAQPSEPAATAIASTHIFITAAFTADVAATAHTARAGVFFATSAAADITPASASASEHILRAAASHPSSWIQLRAAEPAAAVSATATRRDGKPAASYATTGHSIQSEPAVTATCIGVAPTACAAVASNLAAATHAARAGVFVAASAASRITSATSSTAEHLLRTPAAHPAAGTRIPADISAAALPAAATRCDGKPAATHATTRYCIQSQPPIAATCIHIAATGAASFSANISASAHAAWPGVFVATAAASRITSAASSAAEHLLRAAASYPSSWFQLRTAEPATTISAAAARCDGEPAASYVTTGYCIQSQPTVAATRIYIAATARAAVSADIAAAAHAARPGVLVATSATPRITTTAAFSAKHIPCIAAPDFTAWLQLRAAEPAASLPAAAARSNGT